MRGQNVRRGSNYCPIKTKLKAFVPHMWTVRNITFKKKLVHIQPKRYFLLHVRCPSVLTDRNITYTPCSTRVGCDERRFREIPQINMRATPKRYFILLLRWPTSLLKLQILYRRRGKCDVWSFRTNNSRKQSYCRKNTLFPRILLAVIDRSQWN